MIVKVCKRVNDVRGMVNYLMGPGKERVHTNQHTVSGTVQYSEGDSPALRKQLTADLELHSKLHPDVQIAGGPVYHVVLSLGPKEAPLPDAKWDRIATEFMDGMGMTGTGGKATRWTAIRHGLSADGNDHIHIVANLIRQDGTKVSLHRDMVRASKIAGQLERKHGLAVLAGRGPGGNQQPYNAAEIGRAKRAGKPIDRVELERRVRALAESAGGESEFVRRLRADGIQTRPFRKDGAVRGYSVRLSDTGAWYGGGSLAKDLSLPALRTRWTEPTRTTRSAAHEWHRGTAKSPVTKYGPETRTLVPPRDKVLGELAAFRTKVTDARTLRQVRTVSRDLSGALAAGSRVDPALGKPARQVSAWAPRRGSRGPIDMSSVTALLMAAANPDARTVDMLLVRQVTTALMELYRLHRMHAHGVHARMTAQKGARPMTTPEDGMDESLEGMTQTGVVGLATGVQLAAQVGQEKLLAEQEQQQAGTTRTMRYTDKRTGEQVEVQVPTTGGRASWRNDPMTDKQDDTLHAIAGRHGIDVGELTLGDTAYGQLTRGQASDMIDALGDPAYGSRGNLRHTLVGAGAQQPGPANSPAQQYARGPQSQAPGVAPVKHVPKV